MIIYSENSEVLSVVKAQAEKGLYVCEYRGSGDIPCVRITVKEHDFADIAETSVMDLACSDLLKLLRDLSTHKINWKNTTYLVYTSDEFDGGFFFSFDSSGYLRTATTRTKKDLGVI